MGVDDVVELLAGIVLCDVGCHNVVTGQKLLKLVENGGRRHNGDREGAEGHEVDGGVGVLCKVAAVWDLGDVKLRGADEPVAVKEVVSLIIARLWRRQFIRRPDVLAVDGQAEFFVRVVVRDCLPVPLLFAVAFGARLFGVRGVAFGARTLADLLGAVTRGCLHLLAVIVRPTTAPCTCARASAARHLHNDTGVI